METAVFLGIVHRGVPYISGIQARSHLKAEILHTGDTVVGQTKHGQIFPGVGHHVPLGISIHRGSDRGLVVALAPGAV